MKKKLRSNQETALCPDTACSMLAQARRQQLALPWPDHYYCSSNYACHTG